MLNEIQQKLKAPKGQMNNFGKYKYRSCEDILEAVKPLLGNYTLTLSDEIVEIGGNVYVKATAKLSDTASGNDRKNLPVEVYTTVAYAREPKEKKGMDPSQITGAASSYARKYALNGLFCIDDTKDADTMNNSEKLMVETAPIKGNYKNQAQLKPDNEVDPSSYQFTFGKFNGMRITAVKEDDLKSWKTWMERHGRDKVTGRALEATAAIELYFMDKK